MLVLNILGTVTAIALVLSALATFESHVEKRYRCRFFTKPAFGLLAVVAASLFGGHYWWQQARLAKEDPLNGIVLMVLGVCGVVGVVVWNIRRTGVLIGATGTLLQFAIFAVLAPFGIVGLMLGAVITFLGFAVARPVFVINR